MSSVMHRRSIAKTGATRKPLACSFLFVALSQCCLMALSSHRSPRRRSFRSLDTARIAPSSCIYLQPATSHSTNRAHRIVTLTFFSHVRFVRLTSASSSLTHPHTYKRHPAFCFCVFCAQQLSDTTVLFLILSLLPLLVSTPRLDPLSLVHFILSISSWRVSFLVCPASTLLGHVSSCTRLGFGCLGSWLDRFSSGLGPDLVQVV